MSTNSQDQEIDLGQIGKGIKNFFNDIVNKFFRFFFFLKEKIVVISSLFLLGLILAFVFDKKIGESFVYSTKQRIFLTFSTANKFQLKIGILLFQSQ